MGRDEEALVRTGQRLMVSKVGRRRTMTTWAVGDAWEEFCNRRREVIIHSFTAVGLSVPIDGSCDSSQLSLKGIDISKFVEEIKSWEIGGGGIQEHELGEDDEIPIEGDDSEAIDCVAGLPRT
ncbi:hypothetical protein HOY82DRAFT_542694 [Tuber indicum]|nr:hypothetical protein HOY82DRAFT_542694 [Tuber indicum]